MCSLLDHLGLVLRTRLEFPLYHTFFSWLDVMDLLEVELPPGLLLRLLPVSASGSSVGLF